MILGPPMQIDKPKLILSIRLYKQLDIPPDIEPVGLDFMHATNWCHLFAFKLRELKLMLPGFDHLYIYITPLLPHLELRLRQIGGGVASIDCGIDRSRLASTREGNENLLVDVISDSFRILPAMDAHELKKVDLIRERILASRLALEVQAGYAVNREFEVKVLFTAGSAPKLTLNLTEAETGLARCVEVVALKDPEDAFWLTSKVQIKRGCIEIVPRMSHRSQLQFRNLYVLDLDAKGLLSADSKSIEVPLQMILNGSSN